MGPLGLATFLFVGITALFLAFTLVIALALPYGDWDAMSFGVWSRLIAEHWPHIRFAEAGAPDYQRPLFYFVQGTAWALFGFHQAIGKTLSLLFSGLLLASMAWLAARTVRVERHFAAALALVVVLLIAAFVRFIAAGLSDIPAAATVALTAALLLAPRLGRLQLPFVAISAVLAVFAKPSAIPALAGLCFAVLLGPRADLRRRSIAAAAVALGTCVGIAYDIVQAGYVHLPLKDFLTTGTSDGFYAQLADANRRRVLLDAGWLGNDLRVILVFALLYAVCRLVARHRLSVTIAFLVALAWSWLGPHLAGAHGVRVGLLASGGWLEQLAAVVVAGSLLLALLAPEHAIPDRLQLARALVWAAPPFVIWVLRVVYDNRLLAPAWPPLVLLIVWSLLPVFAGARKSRSWFVLVPATALVVLCSYTIQNVNGLGTSGWSQLRAGGISGLENQALMRNIALGGDFSSEVNALAPQVAKDDRILTYDQRLRFYYLTQVDFEAPQSCSQLAGHRIFVLLESDEVRTIYGRTASTAFWDACPGHTLVRVDERPGAYTIFVNGAIRPSVGGCGAPPVVPGLAVEFGGSFKTAAEAQPTLKHVVGLGFVQARVEHEGCASFRIVETGIPDESVGKSIVGEARTAHLRAQLVKR
jgi:hypothetical protein